MMDFVSGLPRLLGRHDTVWIVVDHLTKFVHILPICLSNLAKNLSVIYVHKIVRLHRVPMSIISNREPHFTLLFWKGTQSALGLDLRFRTTFHPKTDG